MTRMYVSITREEWLGMNDTKLRGMYKTKTGHARPGVRLDRHVSPTARGWPPVWLGRDTDPQAQNAFCRSRLGCQVKVTKDFEGTTITLPSATRNLRVDGA